MPGKKKQSEASLGRQLMNEQRRRKQRLPSKNLMRHTVDINEGEDTSKINVKSVTEESSLQEFLSTAEMAGTQFTAERENVKLVNPCRNGLLTEEERSEMKKFQDENMPMLCVPRRPFWNFDTTPEELLEREYQSFLDWRRKLAELEQKEKAVLTPFERNLEFWRQLWRVIERSDVVVQILDARNPLLFYSDDLTKYVSEVDRKKQVILLLNKADYLTENQRQEWVKYFDSCGLRVVFFSAIQEGVQRAVIEEEKQQEAPEGESSSEEDEEEGDGDTESVVDDVKADDIVEKDDKIAETLESLTLNSNTSNLVKREELIKFFKSFRNEEKSQITIGFVGYPNVGKSSTINAILQCKKVSVSATPGKTKYFQTMNIDDELCLCDCPGLVFPKLVSSKAEMVINAILPVDQMTSHKPPVELIVSLIPRHIFESTYSILLPEDDSRKPLTADELLNIYGLRRGFMTKRGLPDTARASRYIIKDFINGKLLCCFAPPNVDQKTFHTYPPKNENKNLYKNITSQQKYLMKLSKAISENDFNREFFKERSSGMHTKGIRCISSGTASTNAENGEPMKPPKKHFNRNKKEKLRRVYGYMDVK